MLLTKCPLLPGDTCPVLLQRTELTLALWELQLLSLLPDPPRQQTVCNPSVIATYREKHHTE